MHLKTSDFVLVMRDSNNNKIKFVKAYTILDSRGNPTVEVEIELENGIVERASVPSGASTGTREAIELRDGDKNRFLGKGVDKAIYNVNEIIFPEIVSMEVTDQEAIDKKMIMLDGTENKSKLGGNAILGVSLAIARAAATDLGIPLYKYIGQLFGEPNPRILPVPMMNFLNGGVHAHNNLDLQEFMIMPLGADNFFESLRMGSELFNNLSEGIEALGVGDEGGFSPRIMEKGVEAVEKALQLLLDGIKMTRYNPGEDIMLALDPAASEFYKDGMYIIGDEQMTSEEIVEFYSYLVNKYPIVSIEDGMAEQDEEGWKLLTVALGNRIQLVGDDLFVTNPKIFKQGIKKGLANAILIKVNQICTLTETLETIRIAYEAGYAAIISHRSGETEDTTISDLAVGCNAGQIKSGCLSRTDRVGKYNQLLRIMKDLGDEAVFLGRRTFDISAKALNYRLVA